MPYVFKVDEAPQYVLNSIRSEMWHRACCCFFAALCCLPSCGISVSTRNPQEGFCPLPMDLDEEARLKALTRQLKNIQTGVIQTELRGEDLARHQAKETIRILRNFRFGDYDAYHNVIENAYTYLNSAVESFDELTPVISRQPAGDGVPEASAPPPAYGATK